jgi:regulatory protein YycH of two-component signal transduction system YycFG
MVHGSRGYTAEMPYISQKIAHDKGDSAQRNRREGRTIKVTFMWVGDMGGFTRRDQRFDAISHQ